MVARSGIASRSRPKAKFNWPSIFLWKMPRVRSRPQSSFAKKSPPARANGDCFIEWWREVGSNHRHTDFQSAALPLSYPAMGFLYDATSFRSGGIIKKNRTYANVFLIFRRSSAPSSTLLPERCRQPISSCRFSVRSNPIPRVCFLSALREGTP